MRQSKRSTATIGGEGAEHLLNILVLATTAEESINNIASLGDYPEEPGEKFNYVSTNLFILSYALQNYAEEKRGRTFIIGFLESGRQLVRVSQYRSIVLIHDRLKSRFDELGITGCRYIPIEKFSMSKMANCAFGDR